MSSKTPAVLFYAADYLVGVIGMTWDEQGRYMYLLALQQQKGHLNIMAIMPDCPASVLEKFTQDENGLYYNERMQEEMDKRYKFVESRRRNASGKVVDKKSVSVDNSPLAKHKQTTSGAYATALAGHMDNDNDNDNNNDKGNKSKGGNKSSDIIALAVGGTAYEDLDAQDRARITKTTYEKLKGVQSV